MSMEEVIIEDDKIIINDEEVTKVGIIEDIHLYRSKICSEGRYIKEIDDYSDNETFLYFVKENMVIGRVLIGASCMQNQGYPHLIYMMP